MNEVTDGVVDAVFGVILTPGHYEARRGCLEFRDGRLVGLRLGPHELGSEEGLTVGLTVFPAPPAAGVTRARAVVRTYSRGRFDGEASLGEVNVHTEPA